MYLNPTIGRRKKLKKDKKKIIITIATLVIGLAVLVGGVILAPKAEDSKKKVERTEEIVTEDLDVKEDKEEISIENEGNIDALSYDVKDVTANNSTTTYDVVVTGDTQNLSTFISGFVHLHKSLNPSDQKIALQLYNSSESLQSKTPNWSFDGKSLTTKN